MIRHDCIERLNDVMYPEVLLENQDSSERLNISYSLLSSRVGRCGVKLLNGILRKDLRSEFQADAKKET